MLDSLRTLRRWPSLGAGALALLLAAIPGLAAPRAPSDYIPTATPIVVATPTPVAVIYLPAIIAEFVALPTATPTATATATPTGTPTPTPTLPPPCPLPAHVAAQISLVVLPNSASSLEQMVGRVPFTVHLLATASGGSPPYSFCWDIEPDGHFDALVADPTFILTRPGVFNPFVVVIDAAGNGTYIGAPVGQQGGQR